MIPLSIAVLSPSSWTDIGAPLGNHLWQSTVFAGAVWMLTLLLRKNRAQSRYVLWLVASAKFLIPFSLLIGLGSHIQWPRTPAATQVTVFLAMETLGEPFAPVNPTHIAPSTLSALGVAARLLPGILMVVWSIGCVAVILVWYLRWRRLTAARRTALPLQSGRELEALRRMEQAGRLSHQVDVLLSKSTLEPGILGIFRPALLLPAGISEKLNDAQLESVIAHELCHVRRRDNLAAALHMLVDALFWFHPLVWWMGARLVDERERACDEEVLRLGADPHVYAEGILKVCKFYLEPLLFCAAGVTGSNLKKRIEAIMSNRIAPNLDWSKKLLLSTMGGAAVFVPIVIGVLHASEGRAQIRTQIAPGIAPGFESASIKPNTSDTPTFQLPIKGKTFSAVLFKPDRFMATNVTLQGLIRVAYGVQESQVVGGPDWLNSEKYDVDATISSILVDQLSKVSKEEAGLERGRILQAFLADRFKLTLHHETREVPGYALVIAEGGPKFQRAIPGDVYPNGAKDPQGHSLGAGNIETGPCKSVGQGVPIAALAFDLSQKMNSIVVDETNLKGNYDFALDCHTAFMERGDSLLAVLPEQLGLELNPQNVPTDVLVIDHAERITGSESSHSQPQDPSLAESVTASMPPSLVYKAVSITSDKSQATAAFTWNFPPYGFNATNVTLESLIEWAYQVDGFQIAGAPDWVNTERYDVQAEVDSSVADELRGLSEKQRAVKQQPMLLELLADRFKLEAHRETRELPVYELVVTGSSPKLQQAKSGESPLIRFGRGLIAGQAAAIGPTNSDRPSLARMLSSYLQRPVLDKTGLEGMYDFSLEWTPGDSQGADQGGPSIFAAVQEQLGLKLLQSNEQTALVQVLVIDHAQRVSGNVQANASRLN